MYLNFLCRIWPFLCFLAASLSSCGVELSERTGTFDSPYGQYTLLRDDFGVPHISADSLCAAFFGLGTASAEDRLFQMDALRCTATGTLSEFLGDRYAPVDRYISSRTYSQNELDSLWQSLPPSHQQQLTAWCNGINAHISSLSDHRNRIPYQYTRLDMHPSPFTVHDLVACAVMLSHILADPSSTTLRNHGMLAYLVDRFGLSAGRNIYSDVREECSPRLPESSDWRSLDRTSRDLKREHRTVSRLLAELGIVTTLRGSSEIVSPSDSLPGRLETRYTFPRTAPSPVMEASLSAPGYHVSGAMIPWLPVFLNGCNTSLGWSIRSGSSSLSDVQIVHLHQNSLGTGSLRRRDGIHTTVPPEYSHVVHVEYRETQDRYSDTRHIVQALLDLPRARTAQTVDSIASNTRFPEESSRLIRMGIRGSRILQRRVMQEHPYHRKTGLSAQSP